MPILNFDKFEAVNNTFERKGGYTIVKEQLYDFLKFRAANKEKTNEDGTKSPDGISELFHIANKFFTEQNLAEHGLRQFTAPDGQTVLAIVADEHASILKKSNKSKEGHKVKNFKSPNLKAALTKVGLIDPTLLGVNQFLNLELAGENVVIKGIPCLKVFTISKGEAKEAPKKAEGTQQEIAPAGEPVKQAEPAVAAKSDWDA